jgi:hypothetical protein
MSPKGITEEEEEEEDDDDDVQFMTNSLNPPCHICHCGMGCCQLLCH